MEEIKEIRVDVAESFAVFAQDAKIDNSRREELITDSPLIENRVPEKVFKEGDSVLVKNYRVNLNSLSKITLEFVKEGKTYHADAHYIMGPKIGQELSSMVSEYMGWLFGNTVVIEQILNYQEDDVSMNFWKDSNEKFHETLRKVLKVRHLSSKFGI
jgi:hypothetical protein